MTTRGFPDGFQLLGPPLTAKERAEILAECARLQRRARERGELPYSDTPNPPNNA